MSIGTGKCFSSMVDGGANICLTGTLSLLVDTISIPPMPISVAVEGMGASIADCCTKPGLLPLQLTDGGVYFQLCYYCENAVETKLSHLRLYWMPATCLWNGPRRVTRMTVRVRFDSTVTAGWLA